MLTVSSGIISSSTPILTFTESDRQMQSSEIWWVGGMHSEQTGYFDYIYQIQNMTRQDYVGVL